MYASIVSSRFQATKTLFQNQNRCDYNQSHFTYPTSYGKYLRGVELKHLHSTSQAKIVEVYTIGMGVQQGSVGRKSRLRGKNYRSG